MPIKLKRIYEPPSGSDGVRILVERLWPRGMKKESAKIDVWFKEASPSHELRKWYGHDISKWAEFRNRYFRELSERSEVLEPVLEISGKKTVTFLFSSREEKYNSARALKEYIESISGEPS